MNVNRSKKSRKSGRLEGRYSTVKNCDVVCGQCDYSSRHVHEMLGKKGRHDISRNRHADFMLSPIDEGITTQCYLRS